MVATTTAQSISWITVSVTLKPPPSAKTTGVDSIGGSQKSSVSAEMRASSVSTIDTPSVTTTMALGERPASGASTCLRQDVADQQGVEEGHADAEGDGGRQGQPQHLVAEHGAQDHGLAGKGEQRAVGDVGAVENAVRQRIAEGEQRIERARMEAVQHLLQEIEHCPLRIGGILERKRKIAR